MKRSELKAWGKKIYYFIWEDDSPLSWLVNIALAFFLIKFLVFPGLGAVFGTSHPVVAVVSESMHHEGSFEQWWSHSQQWYESQGITKEMFEEFTLKNGFNKGDIIILFGEDDPSLGDVIVFQTRKPEPIIHRVVTKWQDGGTTYWQTKGDNYITNSVPIRSPLIDETKIAQEQLIGKAVFRIPFLGYIKIAFVEIITFVRGLIAG